MIRYLTAEEALYIHYLIIKTYGGAHGLHDLNLLESALARPQAGFGEFEAYPSLNEKAGALVHSLIKNHPFIDGNKRTGITALGLFLINNGYRLTASAKELTKLALAIANKQLSHEEIVHWLDQRTEKAPNG